MTTQMILTALSDGYARIEDPAHWCQDVEARGKSGREVNANGRAAVQWCALGALRPYSRSLSLPLDAAGIALYGEVVENVNDCLGHDAVLYCYALAAALVEASDAR